jgi:hypothetical protein
MKNFRVSLPWRTEAVAQLEASLQIVRSSFSLRNEPGFHVHVEWTTWTLDFAGPTTAAMRWH